ncbi:MAG: RNA polymerase sigma factor, partial [Pseudonocardiaceae bacterium]
MTPQPEQALVQALAAGDERAFNAVVGRHHRSLVRLARNFVRSEAIAEEVVQDTWCAVVTGIERFEGRSSLKTWLFSICGNKARTRAERERPPRRSRRWRPPTRTARRGRSRT